MRRWGGGLVRVQIEILFTWPANSFFFFFFEGSSLFVGGFAYIVPDVLVADTGLLLLYRTAVENDNGVWMGRGQDRIKTVTAAEKADKIHDILGNTYAVTHRWSSLYHSFDRYQFAEAKAWEWKLLQLCTLMIINHVVCFWKEELRPVLTCRQRVWPVSEDRRGCMKKPAATKSTHPRALSHRKASFDQTSWEKTPRDVSKVNVISQKNRNECPPERLRKAYWTVVFPAVTQSNRTNMQRRPIAKTESNSSHSLLSSSSEDWVVHSIPFKTAFHIWVLLGTGPLLHFN